MEQQKERKSIVTPEAILSFPALFKPRAMTNPDGTQGPLKYSSTFIFEEGTDLTALKQRAVAVAEEKWGKKAMALIKEGSLYWPFRTDVTAKGYPEGSTFINARSANPPGIVSRFKDADGRPLPITNEAELYPGVKVRGLITFYAFDHPMKKGIGVGLDGVQKLDDGERLDGRVDVRDAFEADLSQAPADIDGLL